MTELQGLSLAIANELIGITEQTGKNDGPFLRYVQRYTAKTMGLQLAQLDNEPWCCMFATWCVDQAAHLLKITQKLPVHCLSHSLYVWAEQNGHLLPGPAPGSLAVIKGGPLGHNHTCLVTDITADHVITIDGNENNQIMRTTHPIANCDFIEIK